MILGVSYCPYCGELSAGVDVDLDFDSLDFVLAPDRAGGRPCPHLAFVVVSVGAIDPDTLVELRGQTKIWLWARGEGTRLIPDLAADRLGDYVHGVVYESWAKEENPAREYRVAGATVEQRDADRPWSGEFPLRTTGGRWVAALLDGQGMYAPDPDALVAEVRRLARVPAGGAENLK